MKLLVFILLIIAGILFGSVFGIIHDQFTYTVSNEYFTKFKFLQFGIINFPDRLAVTIVGILATWWMGLIIGIILSIIGFIHSDYKKMLIYTIESFIITLIITFITGIIGLLYGFIFLSAKTSEYFRDWIIPENLLNFKNYIAVGSMHNFSYLGGVIGMIVGIIWQLFRRFKFKGK